MKSSAYNFSGLLKEGYKLYSGINEAVIKNIDACKELAQIIRTSIGPNGMNKLIINHLDKLFITNDCSTIVNELDVFHPAAKILVMAAKSQQQEIGDGTNMVISFAGELLSFAESLLKDGLHVSEIADGYQKACIKAIESLDNLVIDHSNDLNILSEKEISIHLRSSISTKQSGFENLLCQLVAKACISVCPKNPYNFNVDSVRILKIVGGSISDSQVIKGMLFKRLSGGSVTYVADAKIAAYSQGFDTSGTETKGTVLIRTAKDLENYATGEEQKIESYVKKMYDIGIRLVVSGSSIGEMALHFLNKYKIMVIKITSKFEFRRFCKATGTTALSNFKIPQAEEIGYINSVNTKEIGESDYAILNQGNEANVEIVTIVLRGSTETILNNLEHAINNAVNNYKVICKDTRCLPGGGATEIELSHIIADYGRKQTGLEQYSISKFAEALEVIPRLLAETSGYSATELVSAVQASHSGGDSNIGVDVQTGMPKDLTVDGIYDLYLTKWWCLKLATDAVTTILKVDQIIMARMAGGPKPKQSSGTWDEE